MPLHPRILLVLTAWSCAPGAPEVAESPPSAAAEAPDAARASWTFEVATRIRDASRAFRPAEGGYAAEIAERDLSARFDAEGAHLAVGDDVIRVSTVGWGRDARTEGVRAVAPALGACVADRVDPAGDCIRRLEYAAAGRTEWWSSGEEGFEQGWTLASRADGAGDLAVDLAVEGATVSMGEEGDLWLNGHGGELVLVTGLAAWDADGAALATRFEPTAEGFAIRVADAGARYPITIDPVYTTPSWTVDGDEGDGLGSAVAGAGDVNKDGYDDAIVGAPDHDSDTGRVYVFLGSASGLSTTASTTLTGEASNNGFGIAVAGAGDVNNDGYADVIVGAHGYDHYRGRAYVYLGSAAGTSTTAITKLTGVADSDYLGRSLAAAGDVDNDGYDDVIVGMPGYGDLVGQAFVFHGSATGVSTTAETTLTGEGPMNYFAWTGGVAGAGDVNNDGYDDVIIGAVAYDVGAGRAYVHHGSATGLSTTAALVLTGSADDGLGGAVSGAGDVDDDGYADVLVGARGYSSFTGKAYVHHGSATGVSSTASRTLVGEMTNSRFGDTLAGAGDVDNDGYDDVIVGAQGYDTHTGKAYVFHGSASGTEGTATMTLYGVDVYDNFGVVAGLGDVDKDGYDDVIVGGSAAQASVYRGSASGTASAASTTLYGIRWSEYLGVSVSGAGDVNHDGYADVIVGAYAYDAMRGRAYVFHGAATGLSTTASTTLVGLAEGDEFGSLVSDAGDVDEDGYDDVIVGACGRVDSGYVFHGSATGLSTTARTTLAYAGSGCALSGAGDVDNDGYDDVIVGDTATATAKIYLGSASGVSSTAVTTLTGSGIFGYSVSDAGDVDKDGHADVIVGDQGVAHVFHGMSSGVETAATTTTSVAADDDVARTVSSAGDVNNDGYDDVIVGATGARYATYWDGRMFVYHGSATGISSVATTTTSGGMLFGASLSSAGDVDNDGYDDVIVGTPGVYGGPGAASVFLGSASGVSATAATGLSGGATEHDDFGRSVSGAGDVDGDGFDDVIVGAQSENSSGGKAFLYDGYGTTSTTDADGDGHDAPADCDDGNAAIHPGATEVVADGIDQDCDAVDACYTDADGDNYGTSVVVDGSSLDCAAGTGAKVATDCDDADATVTDTTAVMLYADADGDGFGTGSANAYCTDPGTGTSTVGGDCDDSNVHVFPGASETCNTLDDDCDALVDDADPDVTGAVTWHTDADGDGHGTAAVVATACVGPTGTVASSDDCDDTDPTVSGTTTWYTDADADGHGGSEIAADACIAPDGTSASFDDCDDGEPTVYPGATEACNGVDDDCDGVIDEDAGSTWYVDADEDGYGDPGTALSSCEPVTGYVIDGSDCDDAAVDVNPGAEEAVGDGIDGDCDGAEVCYVDADDDGWRVADETVASADALCDGAGEALDSDPTGDCDDTDPAFHPGAPEIDCADPTDYNCDGSSGIADADEDGFPACEDCDDKFASVNPDADELCNAYDDDCDGVIDVDAIDRVVWNADADDDGYTDADETTLTCDAPEGYAPESEEPDCDDADGAVNPGAVDVAGDGIDQDCSGADATDRGPDDDDDDDVKVGCSCGTGAGPRGMLLAAGPLLAALLLRRRRA